MFNRIKALVEGLRLQPHVQRACFLLIDKEDVDVRPQGTYLDGKAAQRWTHNDAQCSDLCNLEEFQSAWACWRPEKYNRISLTADCEHEDLPSQPSNRSVAATAGGVDSCFTIFRHAKQRDTLFESRKIDSGLFVHGFGIPPDQSEEFERTANLNRRSLSRWDIGLITTRLLGGGTLL